MAIDTVKMSSKGQIVIPQDLRSELGAGEGTLFAVTSADDTLVLKKISLPTREDLINQLRHIAKDGRARLLKKGFKESDLQAK